MTPGQVSIVLPNWNHSRYLVDALAAFRAQTWTNLEIIIVDDASNDDSRTQVERLAAQDKRISLLPLARHVGINVAIGHGLMHARGEFLYCAAADDWVAPEFFERSVTTLRDHPAAAFCFSDPTEDNGERRTFPLFLSHKPRALAPDDMLAEMRRNYFHISSNTVLYRRDIFQQAGGFRVDLHWLSDWFVNNLLALRHGVVYLPEALTRLTIRSDSYSAVNLRRPAAQRELIMHLLDLLATPEFADVQPRFRAAGLFPEYKLRDLAWLLAAPAHRHYLSALLVRRIVGRAAWNYVRPFAPVTIRQALRQLSSESRRTIRPQSKQTTDI
jgi:glycosyltransferase involved in cell wall biosynthesis